MTGATYLMDIELIAIGTIFTVCHSLSSPQIWRIDPRGLPNKAERLLAEEPKAKIRNKHECEHRKDKYNDHTSKRQRNQITARTDQGTYNNNGELQSGPTAKDQPMGCKAVYQLWQDGPQSSILLSTRWQRKRKHDGKRRPADPQNL